MQYSIVSEFPGRIRVKLAGAVPESDLDALYRVIDTCQYVEKSTIYPRIGSISLDHCKDKGSREAILAHLAAIDVEAIEKARVSCGITIAPKSHGLLMDLAMIVSNHFIKRMFFPLGLRAIWAGFRYTKFLRCALNSLKRGRLDVPVLDAAAISMSFLKRDPQTAAQTMLLLNVGEILEEYTRSRSEGALIGALLDIPETAQLIIDDCEMQVDATELKLGDHIAIRTGMPVCVDGKVISGTAMVNQANLTGEPLAVERVVGDNVFAGTAVEDGEIIVEVLADSQDTKLRSIISLVENTEAYKSEKQSRMEQLADRIVPWNFLLAGLTAVITRSMIKTSAALMVDYSCALKLTSSITVLSALSQSAKAGFTVKGSKHFEAMADADTIVFDKTGTLTEANPQVAQILAFDEWGENEVLRLSACLEEHFPHPVARAVVHAAEEKSLEHREQHAEVEYIVAHGIASSLNGKRVVIGSEHFITADENIIISDEQQRQISEELVDLSSLFLAVDGKLVGVLGVHDPLKKGVFEAIEQFRGLNFKRIIMLTGDGSVSARRIAEQAGISEFRSNLLPQDKYDFIEQLKSEGHRVVMVGDGVNDAPALALADVGIAMGQGTAVAREVADVTLSGGDLHSIIAFRKLSVGLSQRMERSFREVMIFNSALLVGGIGGIITPQASSLLHNASTVTLSIRNSSEYRI